MTTCVNREKKLTKLGGQLFHQSDGSAGEWRRQVEMENNRQDET